MSLKVRVNLFFAMLLLASLLASTGVLISNARQSVQAEVENTMTAAARLMTVSLVDSPRNRSLAVQEQTHELVKALSEIRSLHILLFDSKGLLFEGEPEANTGVQPPSWFVKVLFPKVKPLTKRFGNGHMVIYAAPLQEIGERWLDIRGIVTLSLGILVFVGILLYWGVGWVLKPLERLLEALSGFERGDLHLRLPKFALAEMNQISHTFNRMGQALELSIKENHRLAELVKQSGDAILSLDHAGHITFCNPAAERLFLQQTSSLLGNELAAVGFTEHCRRIAEILENCETVENLETGLPQPNGEVISILFSTVPLLDADNVVRGVICTLRDVTEHKQAEAAENQLRETRLLAKHMAEVQENERRHLARELHDELGQCLTAIKTDAVLIRNRTEESEPKVFASAQAIIDTASHIYDVVHNMITRLRPSPLDDLGLLPTLEESISAWQGRQPDIEFKLNVSGQLDNLSETLNMTVFRIVQESITNAVRHAEASEIVISIANEVDETSDQHQLVVDIRDNGKGMEVHDFHSDVDFGLLGMRERAHSLGGQFQLDSALGEGVTIHITLPLGADKTV
ncbi:MAG: PAS domain-containing protein [Gammaproteobacteria bacterium]|nr:PAS domain-containing protein [Gammaproteobacteria bacterium]MDH5591601.1 PAS domain-containing protein [Gammaproteobacteria bacterium]